jgi:protocatechuate 3,4-dioxygenase beta subunit
MEQTRKKFLKNFFIGATSVPLLIEACKKTGVISDTTDSGSSSGSGSGSNSGTCSASATETAGPFPTLTPSTLIRSDIRDDRTGVAFGVKITIKNTNNSCAALSGVIVDIWHCDKDGYYSEYGGSGMQTINYTAVHFLRGRQTTDANGLVTFTSIFPGWYTGRSTHIHVHVYNSAGTSLLITQIAFPEGSSSAVATVNGSGGVGYGYTKGMTGYIYNASDNVFSDDSSGAEVAAVTGTLSAGYVLTQTINVAA